MKKNNILNTSLLFIICILLMINTIQFQRIYNYVTLDSPTLNDETSKLEGSEKNAKIETPYCVLNYPTEYYDYLLITESKNDGIYTQTYTCQLNSLQVQLFTLIFGTDERGINIGYLSKDNERLAFNIDFNEIEREANWTDDEWSIISAMHETANDVIQSIMSLENFTEKTN